MTSVLASVAAGRSVLYWLLADLCLSRPDEPLVMRLSKDLPTEMAADGHPMILQLAALRDALPRDKASIAALAVEYDRLFGAPDRRDGQPPPYESLHREASAELLVRDFYIKAGLERFDGAMPADHIGTELRFMALLCHGESAAWRGGRVAEAKAALENEREFLDRHLLAWAPDYLDMLEGEARHGFYRALAQAAGRIMHADRTMIDDLLSEAGRGLS